jgi:hypothetical protein
MLGVKANQRDVAWAAGEPWRVFVEGLDENKLKKAALRYDVRTEKLLMESRKLGNAFVEALLTHLNDHGPAILLVNDFEHWVSVVGYIPERSRFIVYDPIGDEPFNTWTKRELLRRAWNRNRNETGAEEDLSQYFTMLLRRKDGRRPLWRVTREWMRIHKRGSYANANTIATDLEGLLLNACRPISGEPYKERRSDSWGKLLKGVEWGGENSGHPKSRAEPTTLAKILLRYRTHVLGCITHWQQGSGDYSMKELREFYNDYVTCANACSIEFPPNTDHAMLVAGLTALFSAFWWGAEMGED